VIFSIGHVAGEVLPVPPPANDQGQSFLPLKTTFTILGDIIHCKNRFAVFLTPAGMSLNKLSLAGNNIIIPRLGEFECHPGWRRKNQ
jgi:hypothetical protein